MTGPGTNASDPVSDTSKYVAGVAAANREHRSTNAFDNRNFVTDRLQPLQIEASGEQHTLPRVEEVAAWPHTAQRLRC